MQHLTNRWGLSTNGGVSYYLMDNEHSIWYSTHQDVHPVGPTMQEIRDKFFDYAGKVKAVDPNALVRRRRNGVGPAISTAATTNNGLVPAAIGTRRIFPTAAPTAAGITARGCSTSSISAPPTPTNACWITSPCIAIRRVGSPPRPMSPLPCNCCATAPRASSGTPTMWIPVGSSSIVMLIPRMKSWVAAYYPGTKIGITEYNWGAEGYINGATAQADILGIFGREGLDLATRWTSPASGTPTYNAMKMYRNYDGNKSGFGDTSVNATGPNPDNVSVFAAVRSSDGALTIMVINKQLGAGALPTINLANFTSAGTAQVWQLTSANTITRLSDLSFTGSTFTNTLPAQSITLFVVPPAVLAGPSQQSQSLGPLLPTSRLIPCLGWTAGANATSHLVFFGATSNAVANATTNSPEFKGNLAGCSLHPGHAGLQRAVSIGALMRWRVRTPLPDRSGRSQPRWIRAPGSQWSAASEAATVS